MTKLQVVVLWNVYPLSRVSIPFHEALYVASEKSRDVMAKETEEVKRASFGQRFVT